MFVETTTLRSFEGAGLNTNCCCCEGMELCRGNTHSGKFNARNKSHVAVISAQPVKKIKMAPLLSVSGKS